MKAIALKDNQNNEVSYIPVIDLETAEKLANDLQKAVKNREEITIEHGISKFTFGDNKHVPMPVSMTLYPLRWKHNDVDISIVDIDGEYSKHTPMVLASGVFNPPPTWLDEK